MRSLIKNTDNAQTCRTCGALIDSDMTNKHTAWHKELEDRIKKAHTGGRI